MTPTKTDCIREEFKFEQEKSRPVVVNFKGGTVTSDAGLSLIAELDLKRKITSRFAECFKDYRDVNRIEHSICGLI
ncbi:transposase, partial [Brachyspira hyodysenteriae]|uniref:transposase n=1 Tax=Brachyspira hyodysenteriae TaxID=159 RepID=UPI0015C492AC